jgi:hypothetical protein
LAQLGPYVKDAADGRPMERDVAAVQIQYEAAK